MNQRTRQIRICDSDSDSDSDFWLGTSLAGPGAWRSAVLRLFALPRLLTPTQTNPTPPSIKLNSRRRVASWMFVPASASASYHVFLHDIYDRGSTQDEHVFDRYKLAEPSWHYSTSGLYLDWKLMFSSFLYYYISSSRSGQISCMHARTVSNQSWNKMINGIS